MRHPVPAISSELKGRILWENPSPNTGISSEQIITLSDTDYDYFEVEYKTSTSSQTVSYAKANKGDTVILMAMGYPSSGIFAAYRTISDRGNGTLSVLGAVYGFEFVVSSSSVRLISSGSYVIPIRVWGYKYLS